MSQIEIVIVNWNTLELTRRCLESLLADLRQTDLEYKIWVVDNSSTDGSPAMIRAEFPQVNLVENRENVGFARANNQVLRTATAPLLLLLNSDTVTHQGAIKSMVDQISGRPEIAAVGPKLIYPNGAVQRSFTRLPSVIGELKYCLAFHFFPFNSVFYTLFGFGTRAWERSTALREVEVLSAACVLIRKEVFDRVGLLAEDYFLFSEENDLFCRMKRAGFRSVYLPEAVVTHVVGASRRKRGGVDSQVNFLKSRMIFFRRYHASSYFLVRATYRLFLAWSIFMARLVKALKRSSNNDYVTMYSRLLETLAETRAS